VAAHVAVAVAPADRRAGVVDAVVPAVDAVALAGAVAGQVAAVAGAVEGQVVVVAKGVDPRVAAGGAMIGVAASAMAGSWLRT
jgi:hypothetical protein